MTEPQEPQAAGTAEAPGGAPRPLLQVLRGEPTPEELSALVAVLAARAAGGEEPEPTVTGTPWTGRALALRRPLHPGPGAWRGSGLVPGTRTRAAL